jgi:hypothetical protein
MAVFRPELPSSPGLSDRLAPLSSTPWGHEPFAAFGRASLRRALESRAAGDVRARRSLALPIGVGSWVASTPVLERRGTMNPVQGVAGLGPPVFASLWAVPLIG